MSFDFPLAQQCLRLSAHAYVTQSGGDRRTSTEFLTGGLVEQSGLVIIAFRGSREPLDFITDAKFMFKSAWVGAGKVHRGFIGGTLAVMAEIKELLRTAPRTPQRVVLTGHSLGGARAILAAAMLDNDGVPVTDVITFGAPRVGDAAFRNYYDEELHDDTLRFEAEGDPIPWTPPWLLNGYRHVGRAVYLKNDGRMTVDPLLFEHVGPFAAAMAERVGNVAPPHQPAALLGLFRPHQIENYERLFRQLEQQGMKS